MLQCLGWEERLQQQNLSARGRQDVPDWLLFADAAARDRADRIPDDWQRYEHGLAILKAKRWDRPLDRRGDTLAETGPESGAPTTEMLRYLRRVDDVTQGRLRWGILTNGARWRLYWQGALSVSEQFLEIDLAAVLARPGQDAHLLPLGQIGLPFGQSDSARDRPPR